MKALVCTKCMDIRALEPNGAWTVCRCGNTEGRWLNPQEGQVRVRAKDRSFVRFLGLNNRFLIRAIEGPTTKELIASGGQWSWWKKLHEFATDAKGYIFDKQFRECWAVVIKVGDTGDIKWEDEAPPSEPNLP